MNKLIVTIFGLSVLISTSSFAISGGRKVSFNDYGKNGPLDSTVGVYIELDGDKYHACGGSLINEDKNLILTSAHCLPNSKEKIHIGVGPNLKKGSPYKVSEVIPAPKYIAADSTSEEKSLHDLVILVLSRPISDSHLVPALLPKPNQTLEGKKESLGYGKTENTLKNLRNSDDKILRYVEYEEKITDKGRLEIKKTNNKGGCVGDSGGPLYLTQDGERRLIGVFQSVSRSLTEEQKKDKDLIKTDLVKFLKKYPDVDLCNGNTLFVDVRKHLDWINSVIDSHSQSPSYAESTSNSSSQGRRSSGLN